MRFQIKDIFCAKRLKALDKPVTSKSILSNAQELEEKISKLIEGLNIGSQLTESILSMSLNGNLSETISKDCLH